MVKWTECKLCSDEIDADDSNCIVIRNYNNYLIQSCRV